MPNGDDDKKKSAERKIKEDIQDYINSDMFRQRQENFLTQRYDNASNIVKGLSYLFGEDKKDYVEDYSKTFTDEMKKRSKDLPDVKRELFINSKGRTSRKDGETKIKVANYLKGGDFRSTAAHEYAHALYGPGLFTGVGGVPEPGEYDSFSDQYMYGDSSEDVTKRIKKAYKEGSDYDEYQYSRQEIRSEVWGSRFQLEDDLKKIREGKFDDFIDTNPYKPQQAEKTRKKKVKELKKIQDWVKKRELKSPVQNEFTKDHYDLMKYLRPDERILDQFKEDDVINLMNIIANRSKKFSNRATRMT